MKTKSHSACPTPEQLAEVLDSWVANESTIAQHIEACCSCQQTLTWIAGEDTWWDEARLNIAKVQDAAANRIADSVCALSDGEHPPTVDVPLKKHEVEQLQTLLEPACHPELLGRLGRYELEQLVGRGGMGLVFRAHDTELHRVVAVKTLAVHLIPIGAARERFIREGRAAASLVHPHIVPVHDVITDGPVPALVMRYIAGPTLEQWLAQRGPMSWQQTLQLASQLTDALKMAHEQGLVHRDVKPGNVLLEADASRALLTDFGLVRTLDDATLTRSGMLAGTPDYMSPEQARGENVQPSSDLFALGSMLYAMLTGHPPFRAPSAMAVMNRICHEKHRSVCQIQPEIPVEVGKLVDRLLAKEPRLRFESSAALQAQLQQLAHAKRHLTTSKMRARTVLRRAAITVTGILATILFALVARDVVPAFLDQRSTLAPQAQANESGKDPSAATTHSFNYANAQMPSDVLDLQALDGQLSDAKQQVERMLEPYHPSTRDRLGSTTPLSDMDQQLDALSEEVRKLEIELERQP